MKEIGVKLKDQEISNIASNSESKIKARTQEFILMNYNENDYKPFLRKNGVDVPINYTRIVSANNTKEVIITFLKEGREELANTYKCDTLKTISFIIEEL